MPRKIGKLDPMTPGPWVAVGEAVRARRLELRMTQKEAAAAADVSDTTWNSIERARADNYSDAIRVNVSMALGWTSDGIDRLLQGEAPIVATTNGSTPASTSSSDELIIDVVRRIRDLADEALGLVQRGGQ